MGKSRIPARAGWLDGSQLPKGPNGRNLCRWCSVEVERPRRTFCSDACVHEHKIRTQPGYARFHVGQRDKGVCVLCGIDTEKAEGNRWGHRWEMDHILPVCEGGGDCGLDNLRTLCLPCHKGETAKLAKRRAAPKPTRRQRLALRRRAARKRARS